MEKSKQVRTRLIRNGNALGVRIPKGMLELVGLPTHLLEAGELGHQVTLTVENGSIVMSPYRGIGPSFEELLAPLLAQVSAAPLESQEMVLRVVAGAVDWLARTRIARARLAPVVHEVYMQNKVQLDGLKERGQRLLERDDIVWYLVISTAVTSQADVIASPALTYEAVRDISISSFDPEEELAKILLGLGGIASGGNERAKALLRAHEQIEQEGGLQAVNEKLRAIEDRRSIYYFLQRFGAGSRGPYTSANSLYNPLDDLYSPAFHDQLEVTGELQSILDKLDLSRYSLPTPTPGEKSTSAQEQFYRGVAEQVGLEPWLLERLLRLHYREITKLLDERQQAQSSAQSSIFPGSPG